MGQHFVTQCGLTGLSLLFVVFGHASECTYNTWEWDAVHQHSTNQRTVRKDRAALSREERGPIEGCSVCLEDQADIALAGLPSFKVCKSFVPKFERVLRAIVRSGFRLHSVVAYRVGKSKGAIDAKGLRTEFSNHSYGTAIDLNAEANGLYDNCLQFGPECRLLRGGPYDAHRVDAVTKASSAYRLLINEGFKWGGEINGRQKDFMHFSLSGY